MWGEEEGGGKSLRGEYGALAAPIDLRGIAWGWDGAGGVGANYHDTVSTHSLPLLFADIKKHRDLTRSQGSTSWADSNPSSNQPPLT